MKIFSRYLLGYFIIIPFVLQTTSCKHEPIAIEQFDTVCFSQDIYPIFKNSCGKTGCHDGSEEGFDASSYQTIIKSITPGNANKSEAYKVITSKYFDRMPPSPDAPLSPNQRTLIALWINQGAMNTTCTPTVPDGDGNLQTDTIPLNDGFSKAK